MKSIILLCVALIVFSCTHDNDLKTVDTELKKTGTVGNADVGFNKDDQVIIQSEEKATDQLESMVWHNNELEAQVERLQHEIMTCREYLADERYNKLSVKKFLAFSPFSEFTRQTEAKKGSILWVWSGESPLMELLSFVSKSDVKCAWILMKFEEKEEELDELLFELELDRFEEL